jgi:hypothetical protein
LEMIRGPVFITEKPLVNALLWDAVAFPDTPLPAV